MWPLFRRVLNIDVYSIYFVGVYINAKCKLVPVIYAYIMLCSIEEGIYLGRTVRLVEFIQLQAIRRKEKVSSEGVRVHIYGVCGCKTGETISGIYDCAGKCPVLLSRCSINVDVTGCNIRKTYVRTRQ